MDVQTRSNQNKTRGAANLEPSAAIMKASIMKMFGTALLWVALAALLYVPSSGGGTTGVIAALVGFVSFAAGLGLFSEGLKREIVEEVRRERTRI